MKINQQIKTYEHKGISVPVKIDFDLGLVSLVHKQGMLSLWQNKNWVFAERGLEYMNGWLDILEAMTFAIKEAKKELEADLEEKRKTQEEFVGNVLGINPFEDEAKATVELSQLSKVKRKK
jgi:hypothetical protein